jgi:hypothetical protein
VITHVVLFQPRGDIAPTEKQGLADAVRRACTEAPSVQRFEIGRVVDVGAGYSQGFGYSPYEYVALIEFKDRAGLLAYLSHASHQRLAELFWKACESTMILDVETMTEMV